MHRSCSRPGKTWVRALTATFGLALPAVLRLWPVATLWTPLFACMHPARLALQQPPCPPHTHTPPLGSTHTHKPKRAHVLGPAPPGAWPLAAAPPRRALHRTGARPLRHAAPRSIRVSIRKVWPNTRQVELQVFGSFANGLSTWASDLDLVITGVVEPDRLTGGACAPNVLACLRLCAPCVQGGGAGPVGELLPAP